MTELNFHRVTLNAKFSNLHLKTLNKGRLRSNLVIQFLDGSFRIVTRGCQRVIRSRQISVSRSKFVRQTLRFSLSLCAFRRELSLQVFNFGSKDVQLLHRLFHVIAGTSRGYRRAFKIIESQSQLHHVSDGNVARCRHLCEVTLKILDDA